jgi:hypothetical protein
VSVHCLPEEHAFGITTLLMTEDNRSASFACEFSVLLKQVERELLCFVVVAHIAILCDRDLTLRFNVKLGSQSVMCITASVLGGR